MKRSPDGVINIETIKATIYALVDRGFVFTNQVVRVNVLH